MTRTDSLSQQLESEPEVQRIVTSLLKHRRKAPQRRSGTVTIRTAAMNLAKVYRALWAKSTLAKRKNLYLRFKEWIALHQRPLTDHSATLFLETTGTTKQAKHQYGKELMAILNRMQVPTARLSLYLSGLRALGALMPLKQAKPIARESVLRIAAMNINPNFKAALLVAWKTASRWGEVQQLTGENFIFRSRTQIIIDWERKTKTTRSDPYRASKYTVIEGELTEDIFLVVKDLTASQRLTTVSTERLGRFLKETLGNGFSAHSIKHGAMSHLVRLGAEGLVTADQLELIAKHKKNTQMAATTVRYLQDRVATARFLGTQRVTRLL